MNRRLYRCRHDKRVAGVASGLAEYFDIDPSIVRVLWVVSIFFGGLGLLAYATLWVIVPLEPEATFTAAGTQVAGTQSTDATGAPPADAPGEGGVRSPVAAGWHSAPVEHRHASRGTGRATTIFGIVLMLFGTLALIELALPDWADRGHFLWPAFIVGIGAILVIGSMRREPTDS